MSTEQEFNKVDREKIKARIQKMLNLANDAGAGEGERDNAMRMAHKLMAKFAIDQAELEASGSVEKEKRIEKEFEFYGRPWARNIAHNVARLFFCSYLYRNRYKSKIVAHCFVGRESNVETAGEIAKFVVDSVYKEARRNQKANFENNDWFRSFGWGAANSIHRRVNEMIAAAQKPPVEKLNETPAEEAKRLEVQVATSRSMALALVSLYKAEEQANTEMVEEMYPKLKSGRSGLSTHSHGAREQGAAYGKSVSLNRQVTDSRIKGQLK